MTKREWTRRNFLRTASIASMAGVTVSPMLFRLSAMASQTPQTSTPGDYRAIVCISQGGGNDGHSVIVATDQTSFDAYTQLRSSAGLNFSMSELLPITPKTPQSGRSFGLNPYLTGLQSLFNAGKAAMIVNAGTLIAPTSKAAYQANSVPLPQSLFSHANQSGEWQSIGANGDVADYRGWGGSFADLLESQNNEPVLTCISTAGTALFLAGQSSTQISVSQNGINPVSGLQLPIYGQSGTSSALSSILSADESNLFAKEYEVVLQRSIAVQATLAANILPAGAGGVANPTVVLDPVAPHMPVNNGLANSLQTVARIMGARSALGITRQIFFVSHGGYDTHNSQATAHRQRMLEMDHALSYFDGVLTAAAMDNQVTTFTISDFGRTLTSNNDGTDHGWGSHHIITGGAVQGQDIYGQFPVIGSNQINDVGGGRLIPTTAVEQYAGTLGRWMGLSDSQIRSVFPNFGNFGTDPYLGFLPLG